MSMLLSPVVGSVNHCVAAPYINFVVLTIYNRLLCVQRDRTPFERCELLASGFGYLLRKFGRAMCFHFAPY